VSVIDGATDSLVASIIVGTSPNSFTHNPQQNRVYVANLGSSSISVIRDITGVEERSTLSAPRQTLEIYPNPTKGFLTIRYRFNAQGSILKMFDVSGKMVKALQSSGVSELRVPLKGIGAGVYFVKVDNEPVIKKLVITK
jgi:DNA-binding beta-propeller fold protein YncE